MKRTSRRPIRNIYSRFRFDPRYLRQEVVVATATLVVCLFAGAGLVERYVKDLGSPYVAAVISAVLVDLANEDRAAFAVNELKVNPVLVAAAQAKADDMAHKGYFAHESPEGYDSWHWFRLLGYEYAYAGENLAVDFTDSADVEKAWMASPTHRKNILNANYTEIGIAVATGTYQGRTAVFAVQMFGAPKAAVIAAEPVVTEESTEASIPSSSTVLGEATQKILPAPIVEPEPVGALAEQDGDASVIQTNELPWWATLIAMPKQTLRYTYYIIGLLILFALFLDVEWEFHKHHVRHAMKAGILLATMSALFVVADWIFFAEPILAALGAS